MADKLLTSEQVSQILQVHPFTVLKYIKEGKLRGLKLGRVWRIRESDVEKFLEERFMASPSDKKDISQETQKEATTTVEEKIEEDIKVEDTLSDREKDDHYILE
ncbi:helix-turn-helix domain-containing protein [Patescibacteria group bacterium]